MRDFVYRTAAVTALTLAVSACSGKGHEASKQQPESVATVTGIATETVKTANLPEVQEIVGTVRARTSAAVSSRIPGTISVLLVREGDHVKKGQVLAQLDAQENLANAAAATAGIEEAQQGVDQARTRKHLADTTFERFQKLYNEKALSRQEFDVKQTEREMAGQGVAQAEARLKQAKEGARAAGTMSNYTKIIAPISGIITSKQADLGATVFPGQPLLTIEDEGNYQLELAIPENMTTTVKAGTPVQVTLDALGSSSSAEKIAEIVPAADPGSRTFIAKINLGRKGLKSGMFGRGAISLGSSVSGMLVPRKAIQERGALTSVWVVDKESIAHLRLVKSGKTIGDNVEILSGLSDGERLVISGSEKVNEGVKVK